MCAQLKTFGNASTSCFHTEQFTFSIKVFLFHMLLSHRFPKGECKLYRNSVLGLKNWSCVVDSFYSCLIEFSNFSPSCLHRPQFYFSLNIYVRFLNLSTKAFQLRVKWVFIPYLPCCFFLFFELSNHLLSSST